MREEKDRGERVRHTYIGYLFTYLEGYLYNTVVDYMFSMITQIVSRCPGAICTYLNYLICIHLVQNWPLSMQMSLTAKRVEFTNTRVNSHMQLE